MGVNISDIVPRKEIEFSELNGKTIAVDAYNTLYQFISTIRQADGTLLMDSKGNITSHISGLVYRNLNLLSEGIKIVYVFDGVPPALKMQEIENRRRLKELYAEKYEEAKNNEDIESMKKYSSRTVKITDQIISESKELLNAMGIPIIEAPSEGEAEAASLSKNNLVWAAASQDYDSLLYGAPYLIRNLTMSRKRKTNNGFVEIKPELIEFKSVLGTLDIDRDQLICLAILVGTDYNPGGIKGLGQKRALEIVQKYKYPFEIFRFVTDKYDFVFDWQEIFRLFHEYQTNRIDEIIFPPMNIKKIKNILTEKEFNEDRINSILDKFVKMQEDNKQKSLQDYF